MAGITGAGKEVEVVTLHIAHGIFSSSLPGPERNKPSPCLTDALTPGSERASGVAGHIAF